MLADLTGKTALVTGGGRGIGRGIAVVLTDPGARVAVTERKLSGPRPPPPSWATTPSRSSWTSAIRRRSTPRPRPSSPAAFLGSNDARNITGQCIHVDGGAILRD